MRRTSVAVALFAVVGAGGLARAAGGVGGAGGAVGGAAAAGPSAATPAVPAAGASSANANSVASTNANPLPPPPPSSLNPAGSTAGVPPTPASASPGLPSPSSSSGSLPSQQGLGAQINNELRPSPSLNADQVITVQAALAAGGLFRGPIDGNMTASTRAAVRQFQQIQRLPETGELDAETVNRLQRGAVSGGTGSNGATSTNGNRSAAGDPFSTSFTGAPPTNPGSTGGTATFSTPFPISSTLNTSNAPPAGTLVQP